MKNFMHKRFKLMKNQKGMTLIELMAVVVILGILAAVAGVAVTKGFSSSKTNADATTKKIVQDAAQRYYMESGDSSIDIQTDLVDKGYLNALPKLQATGATITVTVDASGIVKVAP